MIPGSIMLIYGNKKGFNGSMKVRANSTFVLSSGSLYVCGYNGYGQLGIGSNTNTSAFILSATGVKKFWNGGFGSFITKTDGTIWYSGSKTSFPQIASNTLSWVDVTSFFSAIGATADMIVDCYITTGSRILLSTGEFAYCGLSSNGELGVSSTTSAPLTKHSTLKNIKKLRASYDSTFYIDDAGNAYGSGRNNFGECGLGTTTKVTTPTLIKTGIYDIGNSYECTMFVTTTGELWYAGNNYYGGGGGGSLTNSSTIVRNTDAPVINMNYPVTFASTFASIINGGSPMIASDNTLLRHTGTNTYGQLGAGDTTARTSLYNVPLTPMEGFSSVNSFGKGTYSTFILTTKGKLWCSGGYSSPGYQLPDGTYSNTSFKLMANMPWY